MENEPNNNFDPSRFQRMSPEDLARCTENVKAIGGEGNQGLIVVVRITGIGVADIDLRVNGMPNELLVQLAQALLSLASPRTLELTVHPLTPKPAPTKQDVIAEVENLLKRNDKGQPPLDNKS